MPNYLRITSTNPLRVERTASRPSLPKDNVPLKEDYENKTGIKVTAPQRQGLSQDHRCSDFDIRENVISDINTDFLNDCTSKLIETGFVWNPNGIEKNEARRLLALLKSSNDNNVKLECANRLIEVMSRHNENLSYGNSRQNSAIKQSLDLNAPRDANDRHSLSPRSRHISTEIFSNKLYILFSPPKMKQRDILLSSQYAPGGPANKEKADIKVSQCTPRTQRILQEVITSTDAYDTALKFFSSHFGVASLKTIQMVPNHGLVLLHQRYRNFLDEVDLPAEDFFSLPLTKLDLLSHDALLALVREDYSCWYELSNLSEEKLTHIEAHAGKIRGVMDSFDVTFSAIVELNPVELEVFMNSDLEKAISENKFSFGKLVKLYRKDPLHLTCLTSDLHDLVKSFSPDIPPLMRRYAEKFGVEIDAIEEDSTHEMR